MVNNMRNYSNIRLKLEKIFQSLEMEYSILEMEDDDLNYSIQINTVKKLKPLNSINGMLYLNGKDMSMNLIVGNIYKCDNDDDLLSIYEIINQTNIRTNIGNFNLIGNSPKQIFYKSSVNCGYNFSDLNDELVKLQLDIFTDALEKLLNSLKKISL